VRTCVGCRRKLAAADLIRLAVNVEGRVTVGRTLSGRGAWLCASSACAEAADRSGSAARTLKRDRRQLGQNPVSDALVTYLGADWQMVCPKE
jgi:predicted RNA-binding protein YlxR (DUF448 family)